jgi:hypothetical protein
MGDSFPIELSIDFPADNPRSVDHVLKSVAANVDALRMQKAILAAAKDPK